MDTNIFRKLSYGVYVVSTWKDGKPTGCTANSIMQITSSPATIAVSMNHDNLTNQCIRDTDAFAVSILAEDSAPGLIGGFGFYSGREKDKFEGVAYTVKDYLPIINDSCGYLACRVINRMETPTHTVFLAEVTGGEVFGERTPMTYAYYHQVIKGSSPKNAPTYLPPEN